MLVRIKASGMVEDVFDYVGRAMISSGTATTVDSAKREVAAVVPPAETAMQPAPTFRNPLRRLFGK